MRVMLDFGCSCGNTTERFVDSATQDINCECGSKAIRVLATPTIKLEGLSGSFPGAHSKWADIREANARIKGKRSYAGE